MNSGEEIRVRLVLHYDGTDFLGWQVQPEGRTVQGVVQAALEKITGAPRNLVGAGRTDRGVHATGQVAAVTLPRRWSPVELRRALNALLPDDVWIASTREVGPDFHPRYSATSRTYTYRVGIAEEAWSPFRARWCWPVRAGLDPELLSEAAAAVLGEHLFGAFAKAGQPQRGERCLVHSARWAPWSGFGFSFTITADRYLHHMVRYLVGTMVDISRGRRPADELHTLLLEDPQGLLTSPPAPPQGLFLTRVAYPGDEDLRGQTSTHVPEHATEP